MTTIISFATTYGGKFTWQTSKGQSGTVGQNVSVNAGETVTLQAQAQNGFNFDFFGGNYSGLIMDAYSNPTSFIINQGDPNFLITAYFTPVGTTPPSNSAVPIIGSNFTGGSVGGNPATEAPANNGFYWTANHDARILETLPVSFDQILGLTILFNMRNKEGRDFLRDVFKKYMDTIISVVGHLAQAGAANQITAYGHQVLIANILEHNYLIQAAGAGGFATGLNAQTTVIDAAGIISSIFGKGFDVPSTLILAGVGVPEFPAGQEKEQAAATAEILRAYRGRATPPTKKQHISDNKNTKGEPQGQSLDFEATGGD